MSATVYSTHYGFYLPNRQRWTDPIFFAYHYADSMDEDTDIIRVYPITDGLEKYAKLLKMVDSFGSYIYKVEGPPPRGFLLLTIESDLEVLQNSYINYLIFTIRMMQEGEFDDSIFSRLLFSCYWLSQCRADVIDINPKHSQIAFRISRMKNEFGKELVEKLNELPESVRRKVGSLSLYRPLFREEIRGQEFPIEQYEKAHFPPNTDLHFIFKLNEANDEQDQAI